MHGARNQHNTVQTPMKSALIEAVENHDESEVDRLIAVGVDVLDTDSQGRTALLCAVQNNVDINIIRALVEKGKVQISGRAEINPRAQINAKDRYGRSSLFYAITKSSDTASYLFEKACFLNDSDIISMLLFFIESLCTKRHDSHPTIDEVLPLLEAKGLKPKKLAKLIVKILLCKLPLLLTSDTKSYRPRNAHPMFHLHGKRKTLLDILNKVIDCDCLRLYQKKENIKEVLKTIERRESISDILKLLKEHNLDPNFADSDGNTALHYAACLPWMGVPIETAMEICRSLRSFEVPLDKKNHLGQTSLLFCLSQSMNHLEKEEDKLEVMKTLVEVCKVLVTELKSSLTETTQNGESVFHLVMELFQQGLGIPDETMRQSVTEETMKLLHLFTPPEVGLVVREKETEFFDSPLHRWASLMLTVPDYNSCVTQKLTFKDLLKVILDHLLNCGAQKNDRNQWEETPLHLCNTWSAVTLLIDVEANPNDVDSLKRPPLLVAASKQTFLRNPSHFYPDFQEDAYTFFTIAVEEKKLDPWTVDKCNNSVLGFLIEFETYDLSKALVEFTCNMNEEDTESQKRFVSLLKAICKDESLRTHWKTELVKTVLLCAKKRIISVVNEPFNVCCESMISQLRGMVDDEPSHSNNGTAEESDEAEKTERKKVQENPEEKKYEIGSTVQCEIAKVLRSHGAELSGKSYETLKSTCKDIDKILENTEVQLLIPWTSISKRHKNELDKVARRQECQEIGETICYHKAAPTGSFGADLFVGINKLNSKEVAIKRIGEAECTQEQKNLYAGLHCEQVIRYFLHLEDYETELVYIVFELMEGNLDEYLHGDALDRSKDTRLCGDIVKGLNYLHEHGIRHFQDHLKPTSIFYKAHPDLCLKITDFDHRQPADGISTYVWSSPEVLKDPKNHSKSSNIFSCGLLLHYILSEGKHPFSPADCTNKSETDIVSEMRNNIKHNKSEVDDSLSPEATHLLQSMLEGDKSKRAFAEKGSSALDHPFFWPKDKKVDFLFAVGSQPEFECPLVKRTLPLTAVETDLEASFGTIVKYVNWNDLGYVHMPDIYTEMTKVPKKKKTTKRKRYDTHSVVELVRFIRNTHAHVSDSTRPTPMKKQLLEDFVFLEYFPNLVMEVYKAVTTHGWDQTKEEIKYRMQK